MKNSEQPSNPISVNNPRFSGLTKREYFAGIFIQGILSAQTEMRSNGITNDQYGGAVENLVSEALSITDELLKQLENNKS